MASPGKAWVGKPKTGQAWLGLGHVPLCLAKLVLAGQAWLDLAGKGQRHTRLGQARSGHAWPDLAETDVARPQAMLGLACLGRPGLAKPGQARLALLTLWQCQLKPNAVTYLKQLLYILAYVSIFAWNFSSRLVLSNTLEIHCKHIIDGH